MTNGDPPRPEGAGIWSYIKEAFWYRWNVLLFAGASVAAVISPSTDILLPLVGAAEIFYLTGLMTFPRFRAAIDAKVHAQKSGPFVAPPSDKDTMRSLTAMVMGLTPADRQRFTVLRGRCLYMQGIAQGVRGRAGSGSTGADDLRTPALDRLLWVFLKLLYSRTALDRFLDSTDEASIRKRLAELRGREQALKTQQGSVDERLARSIQDSIATAELRVENYQKAKNNAEFVAAEIERIETKIQAIGEMAVSHQDPDFISSQVDSVTESMTHTETAMKELDTITGLTEGLENPPPILAGDFPKVTERQ